MPAIRLATRRVRSRIRPGRSAPAAHTRSPPQSVRVGEEDEWLPGAELPALEDRPAGPLDCLDRELDLLCADEAESEVRDPTCLPGGIRIRLEDAHVSASRYLDLEEARASVHHDRAERLPVEARGALRIAKG